MLRGISHKSADKIWTFLNKSHPKYSISIQSETNFFHSHADTQEKRFMLRSWWADTCNHGIGSVYVKYEITFWQDTIGHLS